MLSWAKCDSNWKDADIELSTRGVKKMTFYDVVMDFILMDAFDDLESPPSSVIAVINNRWLSKGFKETVIIKFDFYFLLENFMFIIINILFIGFVDCCVVCSTSKT